MRPAGQAQLRVCNGEVEMNPFAKKAPAKKMAPMGKGAAAKRPMPAFLNQKGPKKGPYGK